MTFTKSNLILLIISLFCFQCICPKCKTKTTAIPAITQLDSQTIWILTEIDDEKIISKEKAPNLQFNLEENHLYGFSGCNRISGRANFSESTISIYELAATKMYCQEPNLESIFLDKLTLSQFQYHRHNDSLSLKNERTKLLFVAQ